MRMRRAATLRFGVLLALLLPLQAFAALSNCASGIIQPSTPLAQRAADSHCEHGHLSVQHHNCGSCCSVAAAGNSLNSWQAPRFVKPSPALLGIEPPPAVAIDRLDRPPRVAFT